MRAAAPPLRTNSLRLADAAAAGGEEVAPDALARDVLARRRKFIGDFRPVALQFLGSELAQTGQGALPHFGAGDTDHDAFIRLDHHPGIDFGAGDLRRCLIGERNMKAERQAGGGRSDQEGAAVEFGDKIHGAILP